MANAAFVEARRRLEPSLGVAWIDVAGAFAMFDGAGSPLTQTFGLGLFEPFLAPEFQRVEEFFAERGSETFHEVCSFAAQASVDLLTSRRYEPVEHSVVLIRPTAIGGTAPDLMVRVIAVDEAALWARISAQGWGSESAELAQFIEGLGVVMANTGGAHCFLAEADGVPIAAAGLQMQSDVALLAGASTIPTARRRGAQAALLQARLAFAAARGVDLAMIVTQPDTQSHRNAARQGFRVAYSRTKWRRGVRA